VSVRPREAATLLGIGPSTFWRWAKTRPDFPKLRRLSQRCSVLDRAEILAWRDQHIAPQVENALAKRASVTA